MPSEDGRGFSKTIQSTYVPSITRREGLVSSPMVIVVELGATNTVFSRVNLLQLTSTKNAKESRSYEIAMYCREMVQPNRVAQSKFCTMFEKNHLLVS